MAVDFTSFNVVTSLVAGDYIVGHNAASNGEIRATAQSLSSALAQMIRPTWSNAGTTYVGVDLDVTNTASAALSALMDLKIGGASKLHLTKAGLLGVGISTPASLLTVNGSGSFGTGYDAIAAPTNGLIVEGNVGIGTTTPGELLHVAAGSSGGTYTSDRQLIIEGSGQAGIQISSTSTSGIEFGDVASATSGRILYQHSNDAMRLFTATAERMRIDSSGNVGIGTTTPERTLQVDSQTQFDGTDGMSADVFFQSGGTAANNSYGGSLALSRINVDRPGAVIAAVQTTTDADTTGLAFLTHGSTTNHDTVSEQMRITHDGKVGIGTASPLGKLHALKTGTFDPVLGGASSNSSLMLESGDGTGIGLYNGINWLKRNSATANGAFVSAYNKDANANTALALGTHGATRMLIDNTGNVGIGTAGPNAKLSVYTGTSGATPNSGGDEFVIEGSGIAGMSILTPNTQSGRIYFGDPENNDIGLVKYDHSLNAMSLWTNAAQRVTLDSSGNVGIGTTLPRYPLDIWKTSAGAETVALNLKNSDATQGTAVALAFTTYTSDLKTGKIALIRADTGTGRHDLAFSMWDGSGLNEKVRFQGTGNVGIGTTTPTVALDVVGAVKISTTLQVGNTAVAATPTATHTITVKDAAGTTYRLLCVV